MEETKFWQEFGESKKLVLSTSLNNKVTSRNMSMIILNEKLYFQTDKTSRKYEQIKANPLVALCVDNIQIEGQCEEIGTPKDTVAFLDAFKKYFPSSFDSYSHLKNERLFEIKPTMIQRWVYLDNLPYIEVFDVLNKKYSINPYNGE